MVDPPVAAPPITKDYAAVFSRFAAVAAKRNVLVTLVRRDLSVRYAQSALGYLWTILDPLLMASVYFVVFTYILKVSRVGGQPYFLYLLIGLLVWQFFTSSVADTSRALRQEARLVRSTSLPREIWVIRVVLAKGVEFLLSLPVLVGFTAYYLITGAARLDVDLLLFPLAVVLQFALLVGLGLILAPITVLLTDMERVVRIVLRFLFYLTPVIYGITRVPDSLRWLLAANPLTGILELYRGGFFAEPVHWASVVASVVMTIAILVVGGWVFARMERAVLKEI